MLTVALIMTLCQGDVCEVKEKHLFNAGIQSCLIWSQQIAAEYLRENNLDADVKRLRCELVEVGGEDV